MTKLDTTEPDWWMDDYCKNRRYLCFGLREFSENLRKESSFPPAKDGDPDWYMYTSEDWWMDDQCRKVREDAYRALHEEQELGTVD